MKKSIPINWERESEVFILGNEREREFLLTPALVYTCHLWVSFDVPGLGACSTMHFAMEQFGGVENLSATFAMKESSKEDKGIMLCFKSLPLDYAKLTFTIMKVPRFEFLGGALFLAFVGWRWSCRNSRQPPCSDHHKVSTLF